MYSRLLAVAQAGQAHVIPRDVDQYIPLIPTLYSAEHRKLRSFTLGSKLCICLRSVNVEYSQTLGLIYALTLTLTTSFPRIQLILTLWLMITLTRYYSPAGTCHGARPGPQAQGVRCRFEGFQPRAGIRAYALG